MNLSPQTCIFKVSHITLFSLNQIISNLLHRQGNTRIQGDYGVLRKHGQGSHIFGPHLLLLSPSQAHMTPLSPATSKPCWHDSGSSSLWLPRPLLHSIMDTKKVEARHVQQKCLDTDREGSRVSQDPLPLPFLGAFFFSGLTPNSQSTSLPPGTLLGTCPH